jgi:hypothetical protein
LRPREDIAGVGTTAVYREAAGQIVQIVSILDLVGIANSPAVLVTFQ